MNQKKFTTVMGAALVTSLAGVANAAENPFALKDLSSGYQQVAEAGQEQAEAGKEKKEMVCGEGKCGGQMMKSPEMNCGAMKQKSQEQEAQQNKAMEGKCAGMKMDQAAPAQDSKAPAEEPKAP